MLKGALLFALWYDEPHRPTRDADLLGFGNDDAMQLMAVLREIIAIDLDDGIRFDPGSIRVDPIREDNAYGGLRARLVAHIGSARCALQVDVGFGDVVTPEQLAVTFPVLLAGFGHIGSTIQGVALLARLGALGGFVQVAVFSWIQRSIPPAMLGRAMSVFLFIFLGLSPLSSAAAGVALRWLPPSALFAASGLTLIVLALAGLAFTSIRQMRDDAASSATHALPASDS